MKVVENSSLHFIKYLENLHLRNCVFKIKRFSDSHEYTDISESLLSQKNRIYYLIDSTNDTITSMEKDFRFYEPCAVSFILKYDNPTDSHRRHNYITQQRDSYRGRMFSSWIIITRNARFGMIPTPRSDYEDMYSLFYMYLPKLDTFKLYYFCPYCKNPNVALPPGKHILTVDPFQYRKEWKQIYFKSLSIPKDTCSAGLYRNESLNCFFGERSYSSLGTTLNISFSPTIRTRYGVYKYVIDSTEYTYHTVSRVTVYDSGGSHLIYCNYEIRSEQVSFLAWVAPFQASLWVGLAVACIVILILAVITVTVLKQNFTKHDIKLVQ